MIAKGRPARPLRCLLGQGVLRPKMRQANHIMIVSSVIPPTGTGQTRAAPADSASQAQPATSRALVPVQSASRPAEQHTARLSAPFVAHLIAMAEQAPQTRTLRREAPAVAHGIYGRATAKSANPYGKVVSESV